MMFHYALRLCKAITHLEETEQISSKKEIATTLGIEHGALESMLCGQVMISEKQAGKLQQSFGISRYWLLTGTGSMIIGAQNENCKYCDMILQFVQSFTNEQIAQMQANN